MPTPDPLENLRIAAPCPANWAQMAGDERQRHCALCNLNVYNFAEMTRAEVVELLERKEGRVCARLYRRADGTVLTRDCPTGLRALRQRASRLATASIAALLSLSGIAFGGPTCKKPRGKKNESITINIERTANPQAAAIAGVVRTDGNPLPGVTVTLRDEITERETTAVTDENGSFNLPSLSDGRYRLEAALSGLRSEVLDHLSLEASEVTRVDVDMQLETPTTGIVITVGAVAPAYDNGVSATYSQDFINKLPL